MKSNRRLGIALVGLGAALLAAALLFLLHNWMEDADAKTSANEALSALQTAIDQDGTSKGADADTELPTLSVDGHDYVGYLSIPEKELDLPVMKMVYTEDLELAPCLESGSPYSDDAVIAAHNYPSHFGKLGELKGGEIVTFTDLNGKRIEYTVSKVQTIAPTDVDVVRNSEHDLVLYTCTYSGQSRVMVGCDRSAGMDN